MFSVFLLMKSVKDLLLSQGLVLSRLSFLFFKALFFYGGNLKNRDDSKNRIGLNRSDSNRRDSKGFNKLFLVFSLFPFLSEAASELSSWILFVQIFNFSIFCVVFFFLIRKPIQLLCHQRQKDFFSFEKQAIELEKQKKEENTVWEKKLLELKEQEQNIKKKAKEEGDRFYAEKQKELKDLEEGVKKYSAFIIRLETEKLKKQQLDYWRKELIEISKKELIHLAGESPFQQKEKEKFINFLSCYKKEA